MTAGELVVVVAAVLLSIGFAALVVVLMRVLDALRDMRREVDDLKSETRPLLVELQETTDDARATVNEARSDLERFDNVLGSAEAIGDAVSNRVARTAFSSPVIKMTGFARGTSRTIARLRGQPRQRAHGPIEAGPRVVQINEAPREVRSRRRGKRS
ncbi:MAG: hypothetical protein DRJ50_01130 [Actinobacteria bacterium]|nr:MAG: hypothetical protein DRJ50_01130 [Actinomycetota bacterium]